MPRIQRHDYANMQDVTAARWPGFGVEVERIAKDLRVFSASQLTRCVFGANAGNARGCVPAKYAEYSLARLECAGIVSVWYGSFLRPDYDATRDGFPWLSHLGQVLTRHGEPACDPYELSFGFIPDASAEEIRSWAMNQASVMRKTGAGDLYYGQDLPTEDVYEGRWLAWEHHLAHLHERVRLKFQNLRSVLVESLLARGYKERDNSNRMGRAFVRDGMSTVEVTPLSHANFGKHTWTEEQAFKFTVGEACASPREESELLTHMLTLKDPGIYQDGSKVSADQCESPMEKRLLAALISAELSITCQHPVAASGHNYRLDFAVVDRKIDVEVDGHDFHERTKEQAQRDRSRDRALTAAGWTVLRFTGSEVYRDAAACAREVAAIVSR